MGESGPVFERAMRPASPLPSTAFLLRVLHYVRSRACVTCDRFAASLPVIALASEPPQVSALLRSDWPIDRVIEWWRMPTAW